MNSALVRIRKPLVRLAAVSLLVLIGMASTARAEILVASNSLWRFLPGTGEASLPVTNSWTTNGFSDESWTTASAPFYYGSNYNITGGTRLDSMQSNYSCIYLRTTFVLTNAAMIVGISNRVFPDDGFVLYLNGIEIRRFNVPGTLNVPVSYTNQATSTNFSAIFFQNNALTNALRTGTNVLAIQGFNVNKDDRDFHLNPELHLAFIDVTPPALRATVPATGATVTNLTQFSVTFTESVTNVQPTDLRVNGQVASQLTGSGASYTFQYPLPPAGPLTVDWNPGSNIRDLTGNRFNPTNQTYAVTHVQRLPYVVSAQPPFNSTVSNLNTVTVVFNAPVSGLLASDFFVGGYNPVSVTGSNTTYTFTFDDLPTGPLDVTWDLNQTIVDAAGLRMNEASNTWTYHHVDTLPPTITSLTPAAGATVGSLAQIEVLFSEPINGVNAADLLINGQPAASVFGSGAGPYLFQFPEPAPGLVQFAWSAGHGITDQAQPVHPFAGGSWTATLNPGLFLGDVVINEFAAANIVSNAPLDFTEFGVPDDWIELYNRGTNSVRLLGWSLTADAAIPGLWTFPDVTLAAGQYLVVYASGADRKAVGGANRLHTNFKLNPNGSYLALFNAQFPRALVSEFAPEYPAQRNDYSYGLNSSNQWRYYQSPTPGLPNGNSPIASVVALPKVNVSHGLFEKPFTLLVTCDTPGATLRYTTDGTPPLAGTGQIYTGPFTVSNTIIFRVAAFLTNALPSKVATHSYLFLSSIVSQSNTPPGYPTVWQGCAGCTASGTTSFPADYEMDPEILTNAANASLIGPALKSLPVVSLALPPGDMFSSSNGIYANPEPNTASRYLWERACSVELFATNQEAGFQIDCGIRLQGNASRTPSKTSKHPMRLLFKGDYGEGALDYPLFEDSPAQSYEGIVLRADFNNSWTHWDASQRVRGTRIRDAWGKATFLAMGQLAGHTRHVHLFINGLYWGVYDLNERIDASFATRYVGGEKTEWDSIVSKPTEAVDGDMTAYNSMLANVKSKDMRQLTNFSAAFQYVDMTNYVDYMLLNFYAANQDWGQDGNWNAMRRRVAGGLFQWYVWDAERYIENTGDNRVSNTDVASGLHTNLVNSPEYKRFFGDRVQRHLFNGGALTSNQMIARWTALADTISTAQVAESARWGDNRRDVMTTQGGGTAPFLLYDRQTNWLPEINRVRTNYFAGRQASILSQLQGAGLFPTVTAPLFNQFGGRVTEGFALTMSASNTIYYTTNGQDPRVYGTGAISPLARAYSGPVTLGQSMNVKARALFNGTNWSALVDASFAINSLLPSLRLTEIMYNPVGGDAYEFIELQNTGSLPLNIGNYSFTGINFIFPFGQIITPGQRLVLANNANTNLFNARYPGVIVAGWYGGSLNNAGETIALLDAAGRIVTSVTYDDEGGWPTTPDGGGYSLEMTDPAGNPDAISNWRASGAQNGTPGTANAVGPAGSVVINELMADNVAAVNHEGTHPDWVELANPTGSAVDLSNWSLSDDGNFRKFVFPVGTTLAAGSHLVVWCDATTNLTSGLHSGFALGRNGDTVSLYDPAGTRLDSISYGVQIPDYSIGRWNASWELTLPTPGAPNAPAPQATVSSLVINEWLANAVPGGDDWIELFNTSSNAPVALLNCYVGTSNALSQLRSLSFIAPRGFLTLTADGLSGPDHLNFKLPATLGAIVLYDATGAERNRVTYGPQVQGVSQGWLPDGSTSLFTFVGSASPGTTNYAINYSGPILNEILARNSDSVPGPWGNYPDFIELYNPGSTNFSMDGMGLSENAGTVKFTFAPGTLIPAGGHLVVWCDSSRPASTVGDLNTGFALSGTGGGVYLFNTAAQLVNLVEYGFQVPDLSIGLSGGQWRLLNSVTPGTLNAAPAALGAAAGLRINEWMADPVTGPDWFELYNSDSLPVSLAGLYLTDDLSVAGAANTPIDALSFIAGNGWVRWFADQDPSQGRDHARFDLDKDADNIRLYAADFSIIDTVSFGAQSTGVSQGRLPDGSANLVDFPVSSSPEESNYLPLPTLVINEVLAHTDPPLEDAIEIWNTGSTSTNLAGWYVSNSSRNLKKHRIAAGTIVAPGAFQVLYETNFNAGGNGTNFTLNSAHGDSVYLSQADAAGNLTGYRAQVSFGGTENGVSLGRFPTSVGVDFTAMSQRTFGADSPATVAQFRTGLGLSNAYPLVGPVILNEIMYHPSSGLGTNVVELADEEFIELYNRSASAVPLYDPANPGNTWELDGGVRFRFATGTSIPANGYLLVVNFDPATNAPAVAAFHAKYGPGGTLVGPMEGRLANNGESLELYKPDAPQQVPHPDAGYVPMILADRVAYGDVAPWPVSADGGGASLQRLAPGLYGNEPLNWKSDAPTAGATNVAAAVAAPTILAQPTNRVVLVDQTVSFTVLVSGTAPLSFQWQRNNTNLVGEVSDTLTIASAQISDAGTYRVIVTNLAGGITSQGAVLTVLAPPTVLVPPASQTAIAGSNAQFSVTASGTAPLAYQWRFNGLALENQTAPQLVLNSVQPSQAGQYTVVITNVAGAITSTVAELVILVPPVITSDPAGATVVAGESVTFTVAATGTAPLFFQWRKDGINLPGANGLTLTIANVEQSDEGAYSVIVTNQAGMVLSQEAVLAVAVDVVLGSPKQIPGGGFEFLLRGATNRSYAIEFSSNLTGWTNLTNITLTSPQRLFQDGGASNSPARFYRVRQN